MIGAINFNLRAKNFSRLPFINGRLMHAAFFQILHAVAPNIEKFIHDEMNIKPFTVSFLDPSKKIPSAESRWNVRGGDKFFWRVTGLNEEILQAAMAVPIGYELQAGNLILEVEKISAEKIISAKDFISETKNFDAPKDIEFNFLSPVSFRTDNFDAPYPRADLIFSSLADKWAQAQMPAAADKKIIRELAQNVRLTAWDGHCKKFYFSHDRGTYAFWGKFLYNMESIDENSRKVFLLLARFGEFSGVGRLAAQGFGQTRIKF